VRRVFMQCSLLPRLAPRQGELDQHEAPPPRNNDMPTWKPIVIPDAPPPKGPYSPAVRAGDFIYVSGQTPRDPLSGELVGTDIASQTRQTLRNVQRLLTEAGASMNDVVSIVIYLANVDEWAAMNVVYSEFFHAPFPSRTAVGAQLRDILVEVSAVAYVGP
jgi:2-iminobutanoate/2-iminopropanoate deaminase